MSFQHCRRWYFWIVVTLGCASFLGEEVCLAEGPALVNVTAARWPLRLLRSPEIQTELGLNPEQNSALEAAADQIDLSLWQLRDRTDADSLAEAERLHGRFVAEAVKVLRPQQSVRLEQLCRRAKGWQSLQLPSVLDELQLTEGQQASYENLRADLHRGVAKSAAELSRLEFSWNRAVLTDLQRARLQHLLGQPFDFARIRIREAKAPELRAVSGWINTPPLSLANLRGRVVVLNFWTFGCINCLHNLPHYREWYDHLPRDQVVILGVHTPETKAEYDEAKVRRAVQEQGLAYPIAIDNQRKNWMAWANSIWPSVYLIDKDGYIRYWWYGELHWQGAHNERVARAKILELLAETTPKGSAKSRQTRESP